MRARAVLVRGGLGAAVLTLCVLLVVSLFGGQEDDETPTANHSVAESLPRPSLPPWPDAPPMLPPGLTDMAEYSQQPRRSFGGPEGVIVRPRHEPAGTATVVPASGYDVTTPAGPTTPVAPPGPMAPPKPVAPTSPVVTAGPIVPATPVVPAASAVPGAPTAPVVPAPPLPVPTMGTVPGVPMPVSPAAFPPNIPPPMNLAATIGPAAPAALPAPPTVRAPGGPGPVAPATYPIHITPPTVPAAFPTAPQVPQPPAPTAPPTTLPPVVPTPDPLANMNGLTGQPGTYQPAPLVLPEQFSPVGPGADGTPLNDYWRYGLRFESPDKAFSLFVGGRTQFDVVGYLTTTGMRQNIPGNVPLEDGVSFRRARLDMGGTLYRNIEFYSQWDFFNGFVTDIAENRLSNVTVPTDLWVQFTDLPVIGSIRVGNQKPPYGFEHLTSSRFLNFLERSLGFDAFVENFNNGFAPGISLRNTYLDKRGTWAVGLFKNTRNPFGWNVGRNEAEVNGRVTFLPVYADGGKYLLHVGVGGADRDLDDDQIRHRSRLDARNSPSAFGPLIADTGLFFGTRQQLVVPELVMVAGPWSFQSEYYASWVQRGFTVGPGGLPGDRQGTIYMQSVYGEVHYFLTGEHREYDRNNGVFTRVVPRRPLSWSRCGFTGCGAWQLAARYSYLDLNDKAITGGRIHDMTLGVNWFLNPNMKVQWNYFLAHRNVADPAGDGFIQGFATRLAIDF